MECRPTLNFVVLLGVVRVSADMTHEAHAVSPILISLCSEPLRKVSHLMLTRRAGAIVGIVAGGRATDPVRAALVARYTG